MSASSRLAELGIELPDLVPPAGAYVPAVRTGNLVYTAGQLPMQAGKLPQIGKVGAEVAVEDATHCAQIAALNGLAAVVDLAGELDAITRIIKVTVYVASAPGFTDQPLIANGASRLLGDVFGQAGHHARSAVGVAVLPLDAPVEVDLVVAVGWTPTFEPL